MQSSTLKLTLPIAICGLLAPRIAWSADAKLYVEIPRSTHRPYVAIWIENASDKSFLGNVAVWYDKDKGVARNSNWMADMRQWWRKTGGLASTTIDGVTGASRQPGMHTVDLASPRVASALKPGEYEIVVETVRERGDHDLVRVPLTWPPAAALDKTVQGRTELGRVRLTVAP